MSKHNLIQRPDPSKIAFKHVIEGEDGEVYAVFSDGMKDCAISLEAVKALKEELSAAEKAIALQYRAIMLSKNGSLF